MSDSQGKRRVKRIQLNSGPTPDFGDEGDDFVPPQPKNPFAGARPAIVLGLVMVAVGVIGMIVVPFLSLASTSLTMVALLGLVIGGLVVLFLQMPRQRGDGGDGAQV